MTTIPRSIWRRVTAVSATLVLAVTLSACTDAATPAPSVSSSAPVTERLPLTELDLVADPKNHQGASHAELLVSAIVPVMEHPEQALPTTVLSRDASGDREVEVTATDRVVAMDLSGSIAATVWGLGFGQTLVGRDVSTTFPGTEELPVVTSNGHTVNAEAIIELRPDVVITDGSIGPRDVVEQLRDVGIPVVFVENEPSFVGAEELANEVAEIYGAPEAGAALSAEIAAQLAEVEAQIAQIAPSDPDKKVRMLFLYLRGGSGVYYLFGDESGAGDLITSLGGVDVADELGWKGMRPLTDEAMVAANPDLILVMSGGLNSVGGVEALVESKPAIALTNAGQNRRFVDMADGDILSFGPRSASVLDALARAVYAPENQ